MRKSLKLFSAIAAASIAPAAFAVCPAVSPAGWAIVAAGTLPDGTPVCRITGGNLAADFTMTSDNVWFIDTTVNVGTSVDFADPVDDGTGGAVIAPAVGPVLTIEEGTTIVGGGGTSFGGDDTLNVPDVLVVHRGAQIDVQGTSASPVTMTSIESLDDDGQFGLTVNADGVPAAPNQFGGLYLNGDAPINRCDAQDSLGNPLGTVSNTGVIPANKCEDDGEGGTGKYGGGDSDDSSGSIEYLRIAYAGFRFTPTDELNGLSLQGVGSGTTIENVQVHANGDDGIEFFGGTAEVKNVVLTDNGDDSFDSTYGWSGAAQYIIVYHSGALSTDHAFENDGSDQGGLPLVPLSEGQVSNVTIVDLNSSDEGILTRANNSMDYANFAIAMTGGDECFDSDDPNTSVFTSMFCDSPDGLFNSGTTFAGVSAYTSSLNGYVNGANENGLTSVNAQLVDGRFELADFVGAVRSCDEDWAAGWTLPGTLPAVTPASCIDLPPEQFNVPVMGWAGFAALFAGLAGITGLTRRIKK